MEKVKELRAMLNEVSKTATELQEFEKVTTKILEAKLLTKMENIKNLFEKYTPVFEGLKQLRKQLYNSTFLPYMDFGMYSGVSINLCETEDGTYFPVFERNSCSYYVKLEALKNFKEEHIGNVQVTWAKERKGCLSISKNLCEKYVLPINLEQLENKIINNLTDVINRIENELISRKEKLTKQLEALKDIPFVDFNNTTDLPIHYIHIIKECLEGIKKFRLARLMGFEELTENDFYEQLDEVLNNFINPLNNNNENVKIIRKEI